MMRYIHTIVLLLMLLLPLGSMAQSLEIVEEFKENKMSTVLTTYKNEFGHREKQHVMDNKFPFAVLEVYLEGDEQAVKAAKSKISLDLGSHFTVEGVCKTYTNRIVFLISSSVRNVYMTCGDGCKEQVIFTGQTLEQNRIYYGRVKYTPAKVALISENQEPLKKQYFKFRIHPADVAGITVLVTENGQQEPWNVADGIASKKMDYGMYHYVISADRYHKTEGSFTVSDTNNELDIQLRPQFGWLNVSGDNSAQGAYVFATNHSTGDVKQIGTIPLEKTELDAGAYSLRIQKTKYKDYLTTIQIEEGDTTTIRPVLEANFAQLTLSVQNGAEIWLDGNQLGTTSWTGTLELGEYTLEARQANHRSSYTQVVVSEQSVGKTIQLNNPKPIYGTFEVSGSPADATIYVDGKKAGTTPLVVNNVLVGAHKIRIEKEGYDKQEKSVQITEGQETAVAYTLIKQKKDVVVPKFPNEKIKIGSLYYQTVDDGTSVGVAHANHEVIEKFNIPLKVEYKGYEYRVTSICDSAFYKCKNLTTITIPNSVTSIGDNAFSGCYKLISITIPNSVTSIGDAAFVGCWDLTSITIPNSVTSIGGDAFGNCFDLTSITIPNSVTSIGNSAFSWCYNLTSITIPNSVTSIGYFAFSHCRNLTSITIPNSVTSIGYKAFENCNSLTSIIIPNSVTSIGDEAFSSCNNLTSISVDKNNPIYDSRNNCNAIIETATNTLIAGCSNTIIPNNVTSIGVGAFENCNSLTSIIIPNSVTSIGDNAFSGCDKLTSITIPHSVTSIGEDAFSSCDELTSITIPNSVTSIENNAFKGCSNLTSIIVDKDNPIYDSRDNCNAIIETKTNTLIAGCNNTVIPNGVTSIGDKAFCWCTALTSITIPNSVTSIGNSAIVGCYLLTSITIPNSVTSIGKGVFSDCYRLKKIYILRGTKAKFAAMEGLKEHVEKLVERNGIY